MAKKGKTSKAHPPNSPAELAAIDKAKGEALAPYEPLRRYLHEISGVPILTEAEERELTHRYQEQGDREAALKLVVSNLRLVVRIALEYHQYWTTLLLDLIQEGNVGLMQSLKRFDPYRGVRFITYASFWIRAYILKYIMDNWRLVRIGTTQAQRKLFFDLKKEQERLEKMGFDPVPKLVAQSLNVKEDEVVSMAQRLEAPEISLDARLDENSRETYGDLVPAGDAPLDERLGEKEFRELFAQKLEKFSRLLDDRQRDIFEKRMMADKPLTLREIGHHYDISPERVRQIEEEILQKARQFLQGEIPDFDAYRENMSIFSD